MGLFSQLLGKTADQAVKNLLDDAEKKFKEAVKEGVEDGIKKETGIDNAASAPQTAQTSGAAAGAAAETAAAERADALWGEIMPKDENQFDFNGTYREYFEKIFREEFPDCSFMLSHPKYYESDIYSFTKGGSKVLVIELMKKQCTAQKLRRDTQREGIPYLRFYTNCSDIGWWNAKTYVVGKIKEALGE